MALSVFKRICEKVIFKLDTANIIRISHGGYIENVVIKGARISGKVILKEQSRIQDGVRIHADNIVEIGRYTSVNGPNTDVISSIFPVKIGAFCSIARNVSIQEANHFTDRASTYHIFKNIFNDPDNNRTSKGGIVIGNDVWIGTQCVILSGSTIGDGAIIAANSVVSGDIPPYAIAAGSPARVLKFRFEPPIIEKLLELKWWDWSTQKIKNNKAFFSETLTMDFFKNYVIND